MKKSQMNIIWGMTLSVLMITGAYAEEDNRDISLGTIVVTGTRAEEVAERVPASVTVIDEKDIKYSNAKNVLDLLSTREGIVVRDLLGNGKNAQLDLRGFGETAPYNTLILVDGRRVNEFDLSGIDWTQIPLEQVERIEIVRGTGTVLYGDNAVGGVINIITRTPSEKMKFKAGGIAGSYGRNKEQVFVSGGREDITALLSGSYDSTDGYRENNQFRTRDVGGKIAYDPKEFLSLNLSGAYHSDNFGLPGELSEGELAMDRRAAKNPFDEGETKDGYLKLLGDLDFGGYGNLMTDVSYRDRKIDSLFVSSSSASNSEIKTWAITPRYRWRGDILNHANTLIAGVDIYSAKQDGESFFGTPLVPSGLAKVERESYGFYFNNEFSLLENLILSVGARREQVRYHIIQKDFLFGFAPLDDTVTQRENAYSAGLSFLYGHKSSIFVRANRSLRFPLVDEIVVFDFETGRILANPDLQPQRGTHFDVGINHYFGPKLQGNLTLYWAKMKDEIFFNKPVFANENHPETLRYGVEIGGKAELLNNLTLFGNYTLTKAKFNKDPFDGNEIPGVPRHKASAGLRVHDIVPGLIFSTDFNYVGSSFLISDFNNEFEKLDDYYTVDARLSYEWRWLSGFIGLNNITNQEYSEYAVIGRTPVVRTFYPAPERNWVAGIQISF